LFAHSPKIVTDGLVLALDAGNTKSYVSGSTTWFDKSGYGYNGTLTNGPTFNSANGGSIVFDGTNDYANLGNILNLGYSGATLSAWIKTTANQEYATIVGKAYYGSIDGRYSLHARSNGALGIMTQAGGNIEAVSTTGLINTGNWVFVVGVIDRISGNTLYVNGVQVGAVSGNSSASNWSTSDNFTVGFYNNNPSGFFNGNISQVAMHNRALTQAEITQNFNALRGRFGI
jgi:hypothetical protein